ncbi:hypothetical protein AWI33_03435 [Klebsiella aerogenes]|uniref:hypothetical protein n=1 Tax=Klebsiella aerogenes TaxID=548 RepID=UPI0005EE0141|nr:hypothetical protein [Klebsiella aerogenes]KJP44261.1 hypothetical protein SR70_02750 [Klebsiella aerogenes]KUR06400.1 hypothetical protein AWI33_03435 [Klebsiella aerogenes]KUR21577.1 hypothetical protein AWI37_04775 [Klebsiella aerogenes]
MFDRFDYSPDLFHWIKTDYEGKDTEIEESMAFEVMTNIINDGYLISSGKDTYKHIKSICFTESPLEVMRHQSSRYTKFGFAFDKLEIFKMGGRHVIYQSKSEASVLPDSLHWRHVTYNPNDIAPNRTKGVNFTWEREWRLNEPELSIILAHAIIVPNKKYAEKISSFLHDFRHVNESYWLFGSDYSRSPEDYDIYSDNVTRRIVIFDQT